MEEDFLYHNDKILSLNQDNINHYVIVVTNDGEIRLGRSNIDKIQGNRSPHLIISSCDYFYNATISKSLLVDIINQKDIIKGLLKHYENIPSKIMEYLSAASLDVIKSALNYYEQVTSPRKYILFSYGKDDGQDEIRIYCVSGIEAINIIEEEFEDKNYYGFSNINNNSKDYHFVLIVTDDERLNSKYRDALSYEEFIKLRNKNFDEELFIYFEKVWNSKINSADKIWTYDTIEDCDETYYSTPYSKWRID